MATIAIPRVSDNFLLKVFFDALKNSDSLGLSSESVNINVTLLSNPVEITLDSFNDKNEIDNEFIEAIRNGEKFSTGISSITINDRSKRNCYVAYSRNVDSFVDKLTSANERLQPEAIRLVLYVEQSLTSGTLDSVPFYPEKDLLGAHHEMLTKLEGLNASLIDKQQESFRRLEEDKLKFLEEQQATFGERQETLEAEYRAKQERAETRIATREAELEERQKLIDDADNTTARRKTTTAMLEDVKERAKCFEFSGSVRRYSSVSFGFAALLIAIGFLGVITSFMELKGISTLPTETQVDITSTSYVWFLYVRTFFSSVLFVSSVLYLIRLTNSWANRIAQQELDNQQFVRDLNRAHLAVEMCLEWNEKKDGGVPQRLLESLTEGLFLDKTQVQSDMSHPADQLASALIRSADRVKFPMGSGQIELSGKQLSKAKLQKQELPKEEPANN